MTQPAKFTRRSMLIMPLALAACKPGAASFTLTGLTMGTSYNVIVVDAPRQVTAADAQTAIDGALSKVNRQMSNWDAGSEVALFNSTQDTAPHAISPEFAEVMTAAADVHTQSGGAFDTTMGPLIELWGFGADSTKMNLPSDAAISLAKSRAGHDNTLRVGSGFLQKQQPDSQIYLSAIGKGFGADLIGRELAALGITDFMVEIGGDLYASGRNEAGMPWQIGVETPNPSAREAFRVVGVSDLGMASSGDYRNYFEQDGQRYSHLIDPRSGRPVAHKTASATVLSDNAMLADAWATAFLILGSEEGLALAEDQNLAVLFTDRDVNSGAAGFKTTASTRFNELTA